MTSNLECYRLGAAPKINLGRQPWDVSCVSWRLVALPPHSQTLGPKQAYLDPKEPTFLGFPIMISLYKCLKRYFIWGLGISQTLNPQAPSPNPKARNSTPTMPEKISGLS